jgi:hypothetical protein
MKDVTGGPDRRVVQRLCALWCALLLALPWAQPAAAYPQEATAGALRVTVTAAGMQRITGATLAAAGLDLASLNPALLQLRYAGQPAPLELRGAGDGRIDPADEIRFYAPPPGDRWNRADTYWLAAEASPGVRMATRTANPGASPNVSTTAFELGAWRAPAIYDSLRAGPTGDRWFSIDLRTDPEAGTQPAQATIPFTPTLQPIAGTTVLTITGVADVTGPHRLIAQIGGASAEQNWSGVGNWARSFTIGATGAQAQLSLMVGAAPSVIKIDRVQWERPVALDNLGQGAVFLGRSGSWCYKLAGAPAGRAIYDITDARNPQILNATPTASCDLQDGPQRRSYLVTGAQTLLEPQVSARTTPDLRGPGGADAVYIAPAALHSPLAPLIAHRQANGRTVAVVDVAAIYDTWSHGQVDPAAIRRFLQHTATAWNPAPIAAILVGDGSADPFDYTARGPNNLNLIPPYLLPVDPQIGETACESCFGQLDGEDPLSDEIPDIAIGRLPVKHAAELSALVNKIIGYENDPIGAGWRGRFVAIADNRDYAGDFAALADQALPLLGEKIWVSRIYFDPNAAGATVWREPDPRRARELTLAALNAGAGMVTYVGHSNQWQWAVTDPNLVPSSLFGLFDSDRLTNGGRLPIVLAMTCLSSAFQTPAVSGTTIDERLLLAPNGGAIAVWGSTGFGVAYGHDQLQKGVLKALRDAPPYSLTIGELTMAGYAELQQNGQCCRESLRTFALLGDPLTPAKIGPVQRMLLPAVRR